MNDNSIQAAANKKNVEKLPSVKSMTGMRGVSGTTMINGIITGEDYNVRMRGKQAIRWFEIMRSSESSIEAALEVVKQPIMNVERSIKPAIAGDDEQEYRARFIEHQLFHNPNFEFSEIMEQALTFFDFGHAVMEFELEPTEFEGQFRIGIKNIELRKQISIDRWELPDGSPGIVQRLEAATRDGKLTAEIPWERCIHWVNRREGNNMLGRSMLRYVFKDWDFLDKTGIMHMVALEKGGVPTPILSVPEGKTGTPDYEAAIESLREYRANEKGYIIKPFGWELDKLDMTGQTLDQFIPTMNYLDRKIYVSVLAGFLALGSGDASGSRSVGEVQYKPYIQKLSTLNHRFEAPLQKFIKLLCSYNWTDLSMGYPQMQSGRFQDDDVTALATAIKSFTDAGYLNPTFDDEQHVRKVLHLPEAPKDAQEIHDIKREQKIEMMKNPPQVTPNTPPNDANKNTKTNASVIKQAESVNNQLIDIIVRG